MTCSECVLLLSQLGLTGFEQIMIDDRFLLSRQDLSFVDHLADVKAVAQKMKIGRGARW